MDCKNGKYPDEFREIRCPEYTCNLDKLEVLPVRADTATPLIKRIEEEDDDLLESVPCTLMGVARLLNKDKFGYVTGP